MSTIKTVLEIFIEASKTNNINGNPVYLIPCELLSIEELETLKNKYSIKKTKNGYKVETYKINNLINDILNIIVL